MYNHAPKNYICPLCRIVIGIEDEAVYTRQADVFYKDEFLTAFIGSHWWPNNSGSVIIIPNEHVENIYDVSDDVLGKIHTFSKKVAIALKEKYLCDGVSLRQHNEEAGNQDVWHYHLHVFPRYAGDNLYLNHDKKRQTTPEERYPYAQKLKEYFTV